MQERIIILNWIFNAHYDYIRFMDASKAGSFPNLPETLRFLDKEFGITKNEFVSDCIKNDKILYYNTVRYA